MKNVYLPINIEVNKFIYIGLCAILILALCFNHQLVGGLFHQDRIWSHLISYETKDWFLFIELWVAAFLSEIFFFLSHGSIVSKRVGEHFKDALVYITLLIMNKVFKRKPESRIGNPMIFPEKPNMSDPRNSRTKFYDYRLIIYHIQKILDLDIKVMSGTRQSKAVRKIQQSMKDILTVNVLKIGNEERKAEPENANAFCSKFPAPKGMEVHW